MLKKSLLILSILGLVILNSCDKDFSLNGEYKRTPIIFCLLDQSDSIHMVKITRTFLGDGNNNDFAQVADSSYFDQVDAKIIELDKGIETGRVWQLHDTLITNKEAGMFYGPAQKVYTFFANDLSDDFEYKFEGIFDEGKYEANATTKLVSGFIYNGTWLFSQSQNPLAVFANANSSTSNNYPTFRPQATTPGNVAIKKTMLEINYSETYLDNSVSTKQIIWSKPDDLENYQLPTFVGNEFYEFIRDNIKADANVLKREFINLSVVTVMVDENVQKYISVTQSTSSLSQSKPQFTNINSKDVALGLFATRHRVSKTISINGASIKELCTGQYTGTLKFCSTLPEHNGEIFFCQ